MYGEQGYGDALQFVRYLDALRQRGATVVPRVRDALKSLFEDSKVADSIISENERVEYDVHLALLSIPYALGIEPQKYKTNFPYLSTTKEPYQKKEQNLIVFAFGGSPTHKAHKERFIEPEQFKFLVDFDNTEVVSLQLGEDRELLKQCSYYDSITDYAQNIEDFRDSAALLKSADILITSDTSVAHLGGALGIKTWVLLPSNPDWRWGRSGEKTFWYPTLRLFRQECKGRWDSVIGEVKKELELWLKK